MCTLCTLCVCLPHPGAGLSECLRLAIKDAGMPPENEPYPYP